MRTGWGNREGLECARDWCTARATALGARASRIAGAQRPDWIRDGAGSANTARQGERDGGDVLVLEGPAAPGGLRILIAGHLDTVHDPAGPFSALKPERDGIREGPGAVDMKGGVVVALAALEALSACGVKATWTLALNADEETGSFASAEALRALAARHDVGLVVEPAMADGGFVSWRPGAGLFRIDAFGRAAHAGRDFASGVSAVAALAPAITGALALSDAAAGRIVNIGPLEGGEATNIVPGHACAWGGMRFRTEADGAALEAALKALERGSGSDVPSVRVRTVHNRPPKPATPEVLAIADLAVSCARELGVDVGSGAGGTGGVSDANVLQSAGLPCLDGLGVRGGHMHRPDEFVVSASLVERASVLALLLARLAALRSVPSRP